MLSAPPLNLSFLSDDDDYAPSSLASKVPRSANAGVNSWGVTSIGRGFNWHEDTENVDTDPEARPKEPRQKLESISPLTDEPLSFIAASTTPDPSKVMRPVTNVTTSSLSLPLKFAPEPLSLSPAQSRSPSPLSSRPQSSYGSARPPLSRTPTTPRPRRRSSQQRVSLIAGRVSIAPNTPMEPPSPTAFQLGHPVPSLKRLGSASSFLSAALSASAPSLPATPNIDAADFGRTISEFYIEKEIGRGAYGLVKRARERREAGTLGPPLVIKQIIKSRILADCWKKHPKHGTIPIEIYVLSAISNTSYKLPPPRPWSPQRQKEQAATVDNGDVEDEWVEGRIIKGHPNICPMVEFFEDNHYYYLVLPSSTPEDSKAPSDLFDLVETYPQGLPPRSIRTYLGQLADAVSFLHSQGIVHRDIKDENVVLGRNGTCILIDFGSAGLVRKGGWDTFSGTLDYAGPEILRGERYQGKEQDVWAFGVVAFVLLVGECPFMNPAEAQEGLTSPFANASIALDERCAEGKEREGEEDDGGGALGDAAALVRACLQVDVSARPTFEKILQCRFLIGGSGWGMNDE